MKALLDSYNAHPLLLEGLSLTEQEDALSGKAYALRLAPVQEKAIKIAAKQSRQPLELVTEWCPQKRPPLLASLSSAPDCWASHVALWEAEISMSAEALASKYIADLEANSSDISRVYANCFDA
jgi:hypothetical protein